MHAKLKPQNLHDWGSESAIVPVNPLAYIQARNLQSEDLNCRLKKYSVNDLAYWDLQNQFCLVIDSRQVFYFNSRSL